MKEFRCIYVIEGFTADGKNPVRRYAQNKRIAQKIANEYRNSDLEISVRKLQKAEHDYIKMADVEGDNKMKPYYFPNGEFNDSFFGGSDAVCVDRAEVLRLASEWGMTEAEIMERMHEATADEISEYGVYDS